MRPAWPRVGVVGVVDDRDAADFEHLAPHRQGLELGQAARPFPPGRCPAAGRRPPPPGRRRGGGVPRRARGTGSRRRGMPASRLAGLHVGGRKSHASLVPTQVIGARQRSRAAKPRIVAKDGLAVGGQGGEQFGLGLGDAARLPKPAEVGVADVRDRRRSCGAAQFGQRGDFARPAGAEFEHRVVVLRLDGQHAQRHAEMVVVVARAGRAAKPRCSTVWIICRVVVLPTLPVTATPCPVKLLAASTAPSATGPGGCRRRGSAQRQAGGRYVLGDHGARRAVPERRRRQNRRRRGWVRAKPKTRRPARSAGCRSALGPSGPPCRRAPRAVAEAQSAADQRR